MELLIVFTSDNGGTTNSQEPLRGAKGCYYEGGIRVPFIARWPGVVKPKSVCDTPISLIDLYPTFLEMAGVSVPESKTLDGESLVKLLKQQGPLNQTAIFWHFPGYLDKPVERGREVDVKYGFRTRPVTVVREGDWKLHLFHEEWILDGGREKIATNHAVELYNVKEDIGERQNLANTNNAKRDELLNHLLKWIEESHAKLAIQPNPQYAPQEKREKREKGKKGKYKGSNNESASDDPVNEGE